MINLDKIKLTPLLDTVRLENIDDDIYFSKKYSDYISNSRLGLINPAQGGSPEKYFSGFPAIYSDSLILGSAVHEIILQNDAFELCETIDRPTGKMGFMADILYHKYKNCDIVNISDEDITNAAIEVDYYRGIINQKRIADIRKQSTKYIIDRKDYISLSGKEPIFLDPDNRYKLINCLRHLNNNKDVIDLLYPTSLIDEPLSMNEHTILLNILVEIENEEPFELRLKSKLDNFTIDYDNNIITINDVKTTSGDIDVFKTAIDRYHYYRELGMYAFLLSLCVNKHFSIDNPEIKGNFLVVTTQEPFSTGVYKMDKAMFLQGFNEFKYLLKLVAYYTHYGY